jgi:hypothetical protein
VKRFPETLEAAIEELTAIDDAIHDAGGAHWTTMASRADAITELADNIKDARMVDLEKIAGIVQGMQRREWWAR